MSRGVQITALQIARIEPWSDDFSVYLSGTLKQEIDIVHVQKRIGSFVNCNNAMESQKKSIVS